MNVSAGVNLQGKIGVQLLLREVPQGLPLSALNDPFLTLPSPDPINRWFAGRLVTGSDMNLKLVTIVILRDDFSTGLSGITNSQVEEIWIQEWYAMLQLGDDGPGLLPLAPYADPDGSPKKHKPLFFCKRTRQLFEPPCPTCGQTLTECRKDDALLHAGLTPFSQGLRRYLWCQECQSAQGHSPVFFVKNLSQTEKSNPMVADLTGLVQLWSGFTETSSTKPEFPCTLCPERVACYRGDEKRCLPAEGFVAPLSFYDFFLLVRDFFPLDIAAASDLIGGCPPEMLLAQARTARNPVQEEAVVKFIHDVHISGDENAGFPYALRCIQRKLKLWLQAVRQAGEVWNSYKRPLLSLAPEAFWVDRAGLITGLDFEFQIRACLCVLSRAISSTEGQDTEVTRPAYLLNNNYLLPELAGSNGNHRGRFLVESCEPTHVPEQYCISGRIDPRVTVENRSWKTCHISVLLSYGQGLDRDIRVNFHFIGQEGRMLLLQSEALQLSQKEASLLDLLATQPAFDVDYRVVPMATVSADLFSLGLIGARLLLVNRRQGLDRVLTALLGVRSRVMGTEPFPGTQDKDIWLQEVLDAEHVFAPENLFYEVKHIDGLDQFQELWKKALECILNMIAASSRFGYSLESAVGAELLKVVEGDLKSLIDQTNTLLVTSSTDSTMPRNQALASLLNEILSDPRWSMESPDLIQKGIGEEVTKALEAEEVGSSDTEERLGQVEETLVLRKDEVPFSDQTEAAQEETVILRSEGSDSLDKKTLHEMEENLGQEGLEQTLVLSSKGTVAGK